jgi:hypothetical protein
VRNRVRFESNNISFSANAHPAILEAKLPSFISFVAAASRAWSWSMSVWMSLRRSAQWRKSTRDEWPGPSSKSCATWTRTKILPSKKKLVLGPVLNNTSLPLGLELAARGELGPQGWTHFRYCIEEWRGKQLGFTPASGGQLLSYGTDFTARANFTITGQS